MTPPRRTTTSSPAGSTEACSSPAARGCARTSNPSGVAAATFTGPSPDQMMSPASSTRRGAEALSEIGLRYISQPDRRSTNPTKRTP